MRGSTWVFALYACPRCNHCWSAKLKGGKPVAEATADVHLPGVGDGVREVGEDTDGSAIRRRIAAVNSAGSRGFGT